MQVPSLIFNQMIVMAQQTVVDWFFLKVLGSLHISMSKIDIDELLIEAKQMEREQRIKDYNAGYIDAECNHINDAENYVNEQEYLNK